MNTDDVRGSLFIKYDYYINCLLVGEGLHSDADLIFENVILFSGYPEKIDEL